MSNQTLVIGQSGQVARSLAAIGDGRIVCIGRDTLDVTDQTSVAAALDHYAPSVVINASAYTAVDQAETDKHAAYALNCDAVAGLALETARRNCPLIHISTDYVFDGSGQSPRDEACVTGPLNIYGASKLAGELATTKLNPLSAIVRTSWLISRYGGNFVKTMLRLGREREALRIVNDQIGAPTFADDLAEALIVLADGAVSGDARAFGLFHVTNSGEGSWYDVARHIFETAPVGLTGQPKLEGIPTAAYPTPAVRPLNSRLNCAKAERELGIRLPVWQSGVDRCLRQLAEDGVSE